MTRHAHVLRRRLRIGARELSAPFPPTPSPDPKFLAPADQDVAIRAGRLFDSRSGTMLNNQVILIRGDKIVDVGPNLAIPAGARVIDLSNATVMPGMIDAHVHVVTDAGAGTSPAERTLIALANAQTDLDVGFTTVLDMDSRGGFNTVEVRDAINAGHVLGPRMQVVGQSINQRATNYYADIESVRFLDSFIENKNIELALARARRRARGEIARRRLDQDLHDAGFRRHQCTCGRATRSWSIRPRSPSRRSRPSSMNRTGSG